MFCDTPGLRPNPDIYDEENHTYLYPFTATSNSIDVGFTDFGPYSDYSGTFTFRLYEISSASEGQVSYNWVNDNTSVGLAASGSGNIPSFTATNSTTGPITANITVTSSIYIE